MTLRKAAELSRETHSEAETLALAKEIGSHLRAGDWIALLGELGSGKTVFVRGLAEALHVAEPPTSPTFAIVQVRRAAKGKPPLRHVDLYRLNSSEVPALEWEELHDDTGITVLEWAEKAQGFWPSQCLPIRLTHGGGDRRRLDFYAFGPRAIELIKHLKLARRHA